MLFGVPACRLSASATSTDDADVKADLCSKGCYAIVDSGTSGIAVPEEYYSSFVAHVLTAPSAKEQFALSARE